MSDRLDERLAMKMSLLRFTDEQSDRMIELTMREAWALADHLAPLVDELKAEARTQVAEEIAAMADQVADEYETSADDHRDKSDRTTPQGQRHGRTSLTLRDKADAARLVAQEARRIGAKS